VAPAPAIAGAYPGIFLAHAYRAHSKNQYLAMRLQKTRSNAAMIVQETVAALGALHLVLLAPTAFAKKAA
jgi:hypothetical protein